MLGCRLKKPYAKKTGQAIYTDIGQYLARKFRHFLLLLVVLAVGCSEDRQSSMYQQAEREDVTDSDEWRHYLGDKNFSHFSNLSDINVSNVSRLEEVWRYESGGAGENGSSEMQCNPIVVYGILYCTSPELHVFALDAATGDEIWRFEPKVDENYLPNPNRGVTYWETANPDAVGESDRRILYTAGSHLYAIDARTGSAVKSFGIEGRVDLHAGLPEQFSEAPIVATTPGSVYRELLIIGSRVSEYRGAAPGHIRAFDLISGELSWVFHTIPRQGEFGADSWPKGSFNRAGGANSWAGIAIDEERGLAFVPTGSPSFDFYGGERHGNNLFANSLVALNAATGERVWHYQFIRHDLWDRDLPSPPNLVSLFRDGQDIPAVVQATKTGHLFVFHRETGEPLFPIKEEPVVGVGVPGERAAISQPLPVQPPPFVEQNFVASKRNPDVEVAVRKLTAHLDQGNAFIAPSTRGMVLYPGMDGGAEWGGAAWDESGQMLYINANEVPYLLQLTAVPENTEVGPQLGYLAYCAGCHGADLLGDGVSVPGLRELWKRMTPWEAYAVISEGRGRMPAFAGVPWHFRLGVLWYVYTGSHHPAIDAEAPHQKLTNSTYLNAGFQRLTDPEGLPASQPPWGTLTAINLSTAEIMWRIPLGDYPEILAAGQSGLGAENYGGPIVTAGDLLFIAGTPDSVIRAFNKNTGEQLWEAELPAPGFATPMTYAIDGKQYVVVAAGGGKLGQQSSSIYVTYALPDQ